MDSTMPARSASRLARSSAAMLRVDDALPIVWATPFGSMIMITEPSPRMVLPQNIGMCRSLLDIGLTTISSVWKTRVDHDAEGLAADLRHDDEAVLDVAVGCRRRS